MPQGTVCIVNAGEVHEGWQATDGGWDYRMLYISPEALEKAASLSSILARQTRCWTLCPRSSWYARLGGPTLRAASIDDNVAGRNGSNAAGRERGDSAVVICTVCLGDPGLAGTGRHYAGPVRGTGREALAGGTASHIGRARETLVAAGHGGGLSHVARHLRPPIP